LLQAHDTAVTLHAPATVGMHSLLCEGDMCARMIVPLLDCSVLVRASPRNADGTRPFALVDGRAVPCVVTSTSTASPAARAMAA
jgi:hypothetical protein